MHDCGGTIISPWLVITAAHCFTAEKKAKDFLIIPGLHYSNIRPISSYKGPIHKIKMMYRPKKWDEDLLSHDIAILVMTKPFEFNDHVQPILMNYNSEGLRGNIHIQEL